MKKNNISIINEIIMILQNHIEYNTTEFITTHCINNDGSIDYDIKFTLEDSDKEEKKQLKREQETQKPVINVEYDSPVECACEPISEVEETPAPISRSKRKKCGNCKYFGDTCSRVGSGHYGEEVYSWNSTDIRDCFESK